jgi:hypothetical protein
VLRVDALVLGFQKSVQRMYQFVELLRIFFILDSIAEPIHPFTFLGSHGGREFN